MARVYWQGISRFKAKLKNMQVAAAPAIEKELVAAANLLVAQMRAAAPEKSGDLIRSIDWTFGEVPKYSMRLASVKKGGRKITVFAGNEKVRYAHLIEFGTAPHKAGGMFSGADNPGFKARPFFFSTYRKLKRGIKARIKKSVVEAVRKSATR